MYDQGGGQSLQTRRLEEVGMLDNWDQNDQKMHVKLQLYSDAASDGSLIELPIEINLSQHYQIAILHIVDATE